MTLWTEIPLLVVVVLGMLIGFFWIVPGFLSRINGHLGIDFPVGCGYAV